jgi:hypothetical protein
MEWRKWSLLRTGILETVESPPKKLRIALDDRSRLH